MPRKKEETAEGTAEVMQHENDAKNDSPNVPKGENAEAKSKKEVVKDPFNPAIEIRWPNMVYMALDKNVYSEQGDDDGKPVKVSVEQKILLSEREFEQFTSRVGVLNGKKYSKPSVYDNHGYRIQKVLYHPKGKEIEELKDK